jgi:hypothetical protein
VINHVRNRRKTGTVQHLSRDNDVLLEFYRAVAPKFFIRVPKSWSSIDSFSYSCACSLSTILKRSARGEAPLTINDEVTVMQLARFTHFDSQTALLREHLRSRHQCCNLVATEQSNRRASFYMG